MGGFSDFLLFVLKSPRKRLVKIIQSNQHVVDVVAEIVLNILLKNIPMKSKFVRRLRKYKHVLYKLVEPGISIARKRKLLSQNSKLLHIL